MNQHTTNQAAKTQANVSTNAKVNWLQITNPLMEIEATPCNCTMGCIRCLNIIRAMDMRDARRMEADD